MSAMRLMSKADFHAALNKYGFVETLEKTAEHTLWYHPESKKHFTIPNANEIPDFILDSYLSAIGKLYSPKETEDCTKTQFAVTEKKPPLKAVE